MLMFEESGGGTTDGLSLKGGRLAWLAHRAILA